MLNFSQLQVFSKVLELRSFSRAAEQLGVSQPAVSTSVKTLEKYFDSKLLHRGGPEVVPTNTGQLVYKGAIRIVGDIEKLKQEVQNADSLLHGKLLFGASSGPGAILLPTLIGRFKSLYPQINISFEVGDSKSITRAVAEQRLEFGYVGLEQRDQYLRFDSFVDDELILVVNEGHPWAERDFVDLHDIQQEPLIVQQPGSGATLDFFDALKAYGLKMKDFNIVLELGLQDSVVTAVKNGFGIAFVSKLGAEFELKDHRLIEVPVDGIIFSRQIYMVTRKAAPLSRVAELFIEYTENEKKEILAG